MKLSDSADNSLTQTRGFSAIWLACFFLWFTTRSSSFLLRLLRWKIFIINQSSDAVRIVVVPNVRIEKLRAIKARKRRVGENQGPNLSSRTIFIELQKEKLTRLLGESLEIRFPRTPDVSSRSFSMIATAFPACRPIGNNIDRESTEGIE